MRLTPSDRIQTIRNQPSGRNNTFRAPKVLAPSAEPDIHPPGTCRSGAMELEEPWIDPPLHRSRLVVLVQLLPWEFDFAPLFYKNNRSHWNRIPFLDGICHIRPISRHFQVISIVQETFVTKLYSSLLLLKIRVVFLDGFRKRKLLFFRSRVSKLNKTDLQTPPPTPPPSRH